MRDPTDTRDTGPRAGSPLWIYLTSVTVAGFAVLVLAMTQLRLSGAHDILTSPRFWVIGLLILCGELWPIITPGRSDPDAAATSITFSFAALLFWGLPVAALLQAIATGAAGIARRRASFRNAFNAAQYSLSVGAAAVVLYASGDHPTTARPWVLTGHGLIGVALAAGAFFFANVLLVRVAVAIHARAPIGRTLRGDLTFQLFVNLALLSLAPLVVVVMQRSVVLVPLFVLPLIAVYTNAAMSVKREYQANHDELTALPNRKYLVFRTEEALREAHRFGRRVGLLLLDLDRFKEVNDTLGHPVGDRLLRIVAHRLTHGVRPGDVVARLGGDEFSVLLPSVRDAAAAGEVAARLRVALSEPIRLEGTSFDIEASVGIALHPDHAPDFELLLQRADVAMYLAKERRTGVETYVADQDRNSPARLSLLGDLRRALDHKELELQFLPKIGLSDGRLVGMEALVRWRHPVRGTLTPGEFIPQAEQSYLMRGVTNYVVDAALDQAAVWRRAGLPVQVAVNVSARDLMNAGLADTISAGLERHQVPSEVLQLEIAERVLMNEPAHAADAIDALTRLGIALSLDDFGTGYSSLVRLKRLPVQEIKIDSSFVGRLLDNSDDEVIVRSLVNLVRALGLRSVAEGVETAEVAQALRAMGCDAAQGWYFSEPMSAGPATAWLIEYLSRPLRASRAAVPGKATG